MVHRSRLSAGCLAILLAWSSAALAAGPVVTTDPQSQPESVTVAPDGALLVTDDANGMLWRVAYVGK